ncbi:MAG TPA: substrate-binding domain-containing protein [Burkholderiales bacterium]
MKEWLAMCLVAGVAAASEAAEIKVISGGAIEPGLEAVAAAFEKQSGHKVHVTFNTAPQIRKRVAEGERFDVVIAPPAVLDELAKAGKVSGEGHVPAGRVGVGITVRSGAPAPAIGSVDELRQALLRADSVVYNQASSGLYLERLFDRMGIGEQLKPKTTRYANGAQVLEHVIKGRGNEIGFGAMTEIRLFEPKGLKLVGPLPAEVQNYTSYSAVAAASSDVARAFVRYLGTPAAKRDFAANGVE